MSTDASADRRRVSSTPRVRRSARSPKSRLARSGLVSALFLAACAGALVVVSPAYANGPTISGAGSSYASVAIDQWIAQVSSLYGDNVNYSVSSSVIGMNEFAQQQVTFGATEIGYSTGQATYDPPAGYAYQYIPDVAGATCLDYNLDNPITGQKFTNLNLTTAMILGIFTGTITTWGQLATGGLNSELQGDNNPITTVFRTDASGENYILSDYLDTIDPSAWAKYTSTLNFPDGPQAIWPFPQGGGTHSGYNFSNWNGESGSDLASDYVYANPGSITYVETAYALSHHDPCAAVQNLPGDAFVQPSALADAEALLNARLLPDLEQLLTGVFTDRNPKAYTISAYSYIVTPEGETNSAQGRVLGQFIQFFACQGQQSAQELGYSPLPPNLVNDDFAGIRRIAGAAAPPSSVNASTCNDPYVALFGGHVPPPDPGGSSTGSSGGGGSQTAGTTSGTQSSGSSGSGSQGSGTGTRTTTGGSTKTAGRNNTTSDTISGNGPNAVAGTSGTTAASKQEVGLALYDTAGTLLGIPTSVFPMILLSLGLLLLIGLPPTIAWTRRRKNNARA